NKTCKKNWLSRFNLVSSKTLLFNLKSNRMKENYDLSKSLKPLLFITDSGVFYARLFPFFPTSLINVTAGASTIKIYHYVSATVLGNLACLLIVSLIVNGIVAVSFDSYVFLVALVIAIPLFYLYKRRKRKVKILQKDVAHFK